MFHQVQTWHAIRATCTDSSLREGHVYNHASNYLAVDYQLIVYGNIANQIHGFTDSRIHSLYDKYARHECQILAYCRVQPPRGLFYFCSSDISIT